MKSFFLLLKKDLLIEGRTKELVAVMLSLSLLLSVIVSVGVQSAFLRPVDVAKLFPMIFWTVFLLSATSSVGRSFEYEMEDGAFDGLLLTGVSAMLIFLAKLCSNLILLTLGGALAAGTLSVLLNVSLTHVFPELVLVGSLVALGYTALATLVSVVTTSARLKGMLLPLILLPLLFPLFFCAIEITADLLETKSLDLSSIWVSLLISLDVLYLALGSVLFESATRGAE